jgi:ABC-type Fe3+/spermidine/putrescine transport system ATPase subunit
VLAIRPEHVHLTSNNEAGPNSLRGTIREIVFAGATSTVRVDANGLLLEALVVQPDGLQVNEKCTVILDPDKLRLLRQG